MQIMNEEAHWNVPFCRAAQDWEVEVAVTFYAKLYETRRHNGGVDCIWWIPSKRKLFEVRLSSVCFLFLRRDTRWGAILSHGRVYGRLKSHSELVSLCGKLPLEGFSRWIIFRREVLSWWIGVACVRGVVSP